MICASWEETESWNTIPLYMIVLCLRNAMCRPGDLNTWTSNRKLYNLRHVAIMLAGVGLLFVSWELWDFCGVFPVTEILCGYENCKKQKEYCMKKNIYFFYWTGKTLEFLFVEFSFCLVKLWMCYLVQEISFYINNCLKKWRNVNLWMKTIDIPTDKQFLWKLSLGLSLITLKMLNVVH